MFYSLWKLSVELIFKLKCKLSRLLVLQLAVYFISFKFNVDLLQKDCVSRMFLHFIDAVNNQQYRGEIEVFHNKLRVIKCYHMCISDVLL